MQKLMTVGVIAAHIAKATGQNEASIARQLRGWLQQGVLQPTDRQKRGVTGSIEAALFDEEGLARARLLLALSAIAPSGSAVRNLDRVIVDQARCEAVSVDPTAGLHTRYSLAAAIAGTRKDEDWVLEVLVSDIGVSATWLKNKRGYTGYTDPAFDKSYVSVEAVIRIPFSRHMRPLLSAVED